MIQSFTIPFTLPSLNQLIGAANHNHFSSGKMKREVDEAIGWAIRSAHIKPMASPIIVCIAWYEKDRRRDFDNVRSGVKYILDALQKQKIISGDGWKNLVPPVPFVEAFYIDRVNPRVEVSFTESNGEAIAFALDAIGEGDSPYTVNTAREEQS